MLWIDVPKEALVSQVEQRRFDPMTKQIHYMRDDPPKDSEARHQSITLPVSLAGYRHSISQVH
jgi:hypothetical protein